MFFMKKFKNGDHVVLIQGQDNPTMIVTGYVMEHKFEIPPKSVESETDVEVTWNQGTTPKKAVFHQDLLKRVA